MWNIDASLIVHVVIFQAHLAEFIFSNVYIFGDNVVLVNASDIVTAVTVTSQLSVKAVWDSVSNICKCESTGH